LPEPRPLFGTLPLGSMNAVAIRVPGSDEFIVAFHHGLFAFMNLLSKVVARSLPSRPWRGMHAFSVDLETVRELLDHDSLPLHRITELLDAYILYGEPHAAPQYMLAHPYLYLIVK